MNEPTGADPRRLMATGPMRWQQVLAIAVCVALNALDGFDVLSISFASPGIAAEWGIDRKALGFVLSFELVGMAAGSILLGQLADRIGRRATVLACLCLMVGGMGCTAFVHSIAALAATRVTTGLGIGGCWRSPMRWSPNMPMTAGAAPPSPSWRRAIPWAPSRAAPSPAPCSPRAHGAMSSCWAVA
jgi:MFS family permease